MYTKKKKIAFNIQRFANDKLISLDRMKDFLDGCKNIFYMESDCSNTTEIQDITTTQFTPQRVSLYYYGRDNIPDYQNITELPEENKKYLCDPVGLIVTNMSNAFDGMKGLKSLPKLNIDTSSCQRFIDCFNNCKALEYVDIENWDFSYARRLDSLFYLCDSLPQNCFEPLFNKTITLNNLENIDQMFLGCSKLERADFSKWEINPDILKGNFYALFRGCTNLKEINFGSLYQVTPTRLDYIFGECNNIESIDFSGFKSLDQVTNLDCIFSNCYKLNEINMGENKFGDCTSLMATFRATPFKEIDLSLFFNDTIHPTYIGSLFADCKNLIHLDISMLDTSMVKKTAFSSAFSGCNNLESIDGVLDFSSVTTDYIYNCLSGCTKLRGLKVRNLPDGVDPSTFLGLEEGQYEIVS